MVKEIRVLKPEYDEIAAEFARCYGDNGCTCFISAPCGYCTHPGNPANLEEDDEAWEDATTK
jgi:hypothetical protein